MKAGKIIFRRDSNSAGSAKKKLPERKKKKKRKASCIAKKEGPTGENLSTNANKAEGKSETTPTAT